MYLVAMLVLETGLLGVFVSLDLVLFFVFFEMTLVPMYLLIGMWGSGNRVYAAVKFFLYTSLGSAFMLAAIIAIGVISGDQGGTTFDFVRLLDLELTSTQQLWLFLGFGIAFAVKVPLLPFHTWLPDAHTEAPTAGSVLLAGRVAEAGHVRLRPVQPHPVPGGDRRPRPVAGRAGGGGDHLRRRRRHRPARPEAAGGVLVGEPPRLHRARHLRPDARRASRAG